MVQDLIRKYRAQKGMSQEQFAQQIGVVRQTVSKWEKGLSVPDADMLVKISETLNVPVSARFVRDVLLSGSRTL